MAVVILSLVVFGNVGEMSQIVSILARAMDVSNVVLADSFLEMHATENLSFWQDDTLDMLDDCNEWPTVPWSLAKGTELH